MTDSLSENKTYILLSTLQKEYHKIKKKNKEIISSKIYDLNILGIWILKLLFLRKKNNVRVLYLFWPKLTPLSFVTVISADSPLYVSTPHRMNKKPFTASDLTFSNLKSPPSLRSTTPCYAFGFSTSTEGRLRKKHYGVEFCFKRP